jgi:hypothetical protein
MSCHVLIMDPHGLITWSNVLVMPRFGTDYRFPHTDHLFQPADHQPPHPTHQRKAPSPRAGSPRYAILGAVIISKRVSEKLTFGVAGRW